jgi:hypothetical protein
VTCHSLRSLHAPPRHSEVALRFRPFLLFLTEDSSLRSSPSRSSSHMLCYHKMFIKPTGTTVSATGKNLYRPTAGKRSGSNPAVSRSRQPLRGAATHGSPSSSQDGLFAPRDRGDGVGTGRARVTQVGRPACYLFPAARKFRLTSCRLVRVARSVRRPAFPFGRTPFAYPGEGASTPEFQAQ